MKRTHGSGVLQTSLRLTALCFLFNFPVNTLATNSEGLPDTNELACRQWCSDTPHCKRCTPSSYCSAGEKKLKTYKGPSKSWIACGNTLREADAHRVREDCNTWCRTSEQCHRCVVTSLCPHGFKTLRQFKGEGISYSACGRPVSVRPFGIENKNRVLTPGSGKIQIEN